MSEALEVPEVEVIDDAAAAVAALDPTGWRPFNLIVADAGRAFWLCHRGGGTMAVTAIPPGLHMIEGGDLDDD